MQRRTIDLSHVSVLVLDEADRMLDMGFIQDVRRIIGAVPRERQTMLFSATISGEVKDLAAHILRNPHMVEAGERRSPAETITQHFYAATSSGKPGLLLHALETEKMESVLVFARTKHGADKITRHLERKGISSTAIHSNRTQAQRQRALDGFKQGRYRVLVATDIAARGIDVDGISHVINYDIPRYAEDYIHRIGRTGRAGATGDAVTFLADDDRPHLKKIEKFTGKHFAVREYPGYVPGPDDRMPQRRPDPGVHRQTQPSNAHSHASAVRTQKHPLHKHAPTNDKRNRRPGKKQRFEFGRKKKSGRKLESFSSDSSWSNY
jgi:ATP-dependent RNA helicase RhlE